MKKIFVFLLAFGMLIVNNGMAVSVVLEGQAAIDYLENMGMEIRVEDDWTDLADEPSDGLSQQNKCVVQPQIYCCARYKDKNQEYGQDLSSLDTGDAFSANAIQRQLEIGKRNYGIYLRITPSWADDGYEIKRLDFVFKDPSGNKIYSTGCDADITCRNGYFVSWNFINLMDLFREQLALKGKIAKGKYTLDLYFNSKWAGSTYFKIAN